MQKIIFLRKKTMNRKSIFLETIKIKKKRDTLCIYTH